jgi:hypothetical protein
MSVGDTTARSRHRHRREGAIELALKSDPASDPVSPESDAQTAVEE